MPRPFPDHTTLLAFGRTVRELRARLNISQEELGFRAQMHRNRIGSIERGEANVNFLGTLRLLAALRVPLAEFAVIWHRQHAELCTEATRHELRR
jgi:transcriptional regulator with XRE-family HTH domain